jgi:hypothetical protein
VTPPGIIVLLTGDGDGYTKGKGFITTLERAHRHGWEIELVSWTAGCKRALREFAEQNGKYRSLEPVYDKVTFTKKRRALPI